MIITTTTTITIIYVIFFSKSRFCHWKCQNSQGADHLFFSQKESQKLWMHLCRRCFLCSFQYLQFL